MKARVTIDRGPKQLESFEGEILAETDTHLFVQHGVNKDGGEWFARNSKIVKTNEHNHRS